MDCSNLPAQSHPLLSSTLTAMLLLGFCPVNFVGSAPTPPIFSGEDTGEETPISTVLNPVALAKLIEHDAAFLKKKLCEDHSVCANSVEMLAENTLELPKITTEDRCYSSGFRKEKCLQKIHNDLLKYKIYLVHVKETFTSDKNIVEAIEYKTSILAETVQKMMKRSKIESNENKTQNTTQITQVLKSENIWIQKVTNRLILQGFIDFIQKTARVIRFIGTFHGGKKD